MNRRDECCGYIRIRLLYPGRTERGRGVRVRVTERCGRGDTYMHERSTEEQRRAEKRDSCQAKGDRYAQHSTAVAWFGSDMYTMT